MDGPGCLSAIVAARSSSPPRWGYICSTSRCVANHESSGASSARWAPRCCRCTGAHVPRRCASSASRARSRMCSSNSGGAACLFCSRRRGGGAVTTGGGRLSWARSRIWESRRPRCCRRCFADFHRERWPGVFRRQDSLWTALDRRNTIASQDWHGILSWASGRGGGGGGRASCRSCGHCLPRSRRRLAGTPGGSAAHCATSA